LRNAYHGATIGAQSLTGISGFRHNIPLLGGTHHVANPDPYRGAFGDDTEAYLAEIDRTILYATSGKLAGLIIEPIQGYGGIVELPPGYLKAAAAKVRERGGVLIVDEVQSGFGRTGDNYWAFEAHDVVPEIVVMAKGIGNGFPLGAVVAKRDVAESLASKFFFNTYGANPVSCAAGRAVLRVIDEERLQENSKQVGGALKQVLLRLHQKHEIVGEVRGRGLMMAIELVTDRKTKKPAVKETADIFEKMREHGLVASKSGANRNIIRMVPPMCLQLHDVEAVADALARCFDARGHRPPGAVSQTSHATPLACSESRIPAGRMLALSTVAPWPYPAIPHSATLRPCNTSHLPMRCFASSGRRSCVATAVSDSPCWLSPRCRWPCRRPHSSHRSS